MMEVGSMEQTQLLTNEESRIPIYHVAQPTVPRTVTPATRLDELNLNWREKDMPERERTKHVHRLHPYLGKFIPQLVEIFLRKYFRAGETIYDPFCGSGTMLVEANVLNIHSIGCDIASFNCLLTKVKTDKYDMALMKREVLDILAQVEDRTQATLFNQHISGSDVEETDNEYILAWFAPQTKKELLTYRALIPNYHYQDLLKVILSRSARSARLTTHFDLDFPKQPQTEPYYCYKHSRTCHPVQEAFKFLKRYSLDTIRRVEEFSQLRSETRVTVLRGDARTVELPGRIDGVITSPPYVGLIDYHEQHRYAYELLGLPLNSLNEIGAAFKGNSRRVKGVYQEEITAVFAHVGRYMEKGKRAIVIVRDRDRLYDDIAAQSGFEVEGKLQRHVNRRTGRRANELFEDVLVWRKM